MIALTSLVLALAPIALILWLVWAAGHRRACFTDTINRTMPVINGVRQPPHVPPLDAVSFGRVVCRAISRTHEPLR